MTTSDDSTWPRCRYCGKKLVRYWHEVEVAEAAPVPTTHNNRAVLLSRERKQQKTKFKQMSSGFESVGRRWTTKPGNREVKVWTGEYHARGTGAHFCKIDCAERFASAAVRAGFVITKGGVK